MEAAPKRIVRYTEQPEAAAAFPGIHPVLQRVFAHRSLTADELTLELDQLLPATLLSQIEQAAALLEAAILTHQRILIVADFDADGATSCALAIRALRSMGAAQVDYVVPNRFEFGYGLTPEIVACALEYEPDLIMTVDNGISSIDGVETAKQADIRVLVTDHHLPGDQLPAADAIVNPNAPGDSFPSKHLAGVGVTFYVMAALRSRLRQNDRFQQLGIAEPNLADLLDLVALGTVADVVPLDHNNRILVQQGIRRIRAGHCCEGIKALLALSGKTSANLVASDLGFRVGPRLNAAGRLDDMSLGIECLLTDDPQQAREMAGELNALNQARREIEAEMKQQAMADLQALAFDHTQLPHGICIFRDEWHQGVIGILAARIRERYHRPVIAFAMTDEGDLKGSARSIPGLHIRDLLDSIAKHHPQILDKFGGHAMAAGLTLQHQHFETFSRLFDEAAAVQLREVGLDDTLRSDGELTVHDIGLELAGLLRNGIPWGQGFPEPQFDGKFHVVSQRVVGDNHLKLVLALDDSEKQIDAIAFGQAERAAGESLGKIHAVYQLDINEYRGQQREQLIIEYFDRLEQ